MANITVFCAGNPGNLPIHPLAAQSLGTAIAKRGHTLVYGGANGGLMGAVADATLAAGGKAVGILPKVLEKREIAHTGLTDLRVVESLSERKDLLLGMADAVVTLPGGLGTLDELFEAATWAQLNLKNFPIGVINTLGYYDHLLWFLDRAVTDGLLLPHYRALIQSADTPEALLDLFQL
ncbi:MAG: TIGR00730 family Rossman fold protein [Polyangiaceae bacterium]|nr:TIGR00730 family Rossman fold protein [Polyangiaceae bacterium]